MDLYYIVALLTFACILNWPDYAAGQTCPAGVTPIPLEKFAAGTMRKSPYLHIFNDYKFTCSGQLMQWDFITYGTAKVVYMDIWRKMAAPDDNKLKLIGSTVIAPKTSLAVQSYTLKANEHIAVQVGDMIGFHYAPNEKLDEENLLIPHLEEADAPNPSLAFVWEYSTPIIAQLGNTISLNGTMITTVKRQPALRAYLSGNDNATGHLVAKPAFLADNFGPIARGRSPSRMRTKSKMSPAINTILRRRPRQAQAPVTVAPLAQATGPSAPGKNPPLPRTKSKISPAITSILRRRPREGESQVAIAPLAQANYSTGPNVRDKNPPTRTKTKMSAAVPTILRRRPREAEPAMATAPLKQANNSIGPIARDKSPATRSKTKISPAVSTILRRRPREAEPAMATAPLKQANNSIGPIARDTKNPPPLTHTKSKMSPGITSILRRRPREAAPPVASATLTQANDSIGPVVRDIKSPSITHTKNKMSPSISVLLRRRPRQAVTTIPPAVTTVPPVVTTVPPVVTTVPPVVTTVPKAASPTPSVLNQAVQVALTFATMTVNGTPVWIIVTIIAALCGVIILVLLILLCYACCCRNKSPQSNYYNSSGAGKRGPLPPDMVKIVEVQTDYSKDFSPPATVEKGVNTKRVINITPTKQDEPPPIQPPPVQATAPPAPQPSQTPGNLPIIKMIFGNNGNGQPPHIIHHDANGNQRLVHATQGNNGEHIFHGFF